MDGIAVYTFKNYRIYLTRSEKEGLYDYILYKWNPTLGQGWNYLDGILDIIGTDNYHDYVIELMERESHNTTAYHY